MEEEICNSGEMSIFKKRVVPDHPIIKLIQAGENQQLDFKFEISDSRKIARTFSAFANTLGGSLLIGVKDNGKIAGIRTDEEYYMAEAAALMYCKPEVPFTTEKWNIEGKSVLVIRIPEGSNKPYLAQDENGKWRAYLRVGDQNTVAHPVQYKVWKRRTNPEGVFIRYTRNEEILLQYLKEHHEISFSRFLKVARIRKFEAENTLADLIIAGVIRMEQDGEVIRYVLDHPPEDL